MASRELLHLEHPSPLEKRLRILDEELPKEPEDMRSAAAQLLCQPSVLGRLKTFLPEMDEANRRLSSMIEDNGADKYDIQSISEGEESHIQMDLALGVAELYTEAAVAAAQRVVGDQIHCLEVDDLDENRMEESEEIEGNVQKKRRLVEAVSQSI